ncbi:MAG: hypothetical protein GQ540_03570 [Lutibacter sp.]|nr:hypothetical protein [Lutibacter sp.]
MNIKLKPGDILLTLVHGWLGNAIIRTQNMIDCETDIVNFSHAAIVLDECGNIFESSLKIGANHISKYENVPVLIARHKDMEDWKFKKGIGEALDNEGMFYPLHRLFFILFGISAIRTDWPVCSELVAQFLLKSGIDSDLIRKGKKYSKWYGVSPDMIEDAVFRGENWNVVYNGNWDSRLLSNKY